MDFRYMAGALAGVWLTVCPVIAPPAPATVWEKPAAVQQPVQLPVSFPEKPAEETAESEDGSFKIVMSFTGDMLLASGDGLQARGNFLDYAAAQKPEYFLQNVRHIFADDDFTLVNLENVLTDRALEPREKDGDVAFWFRGGTANTAILTTSGVEAVSLANNHTHDYGAKGYADTVRAIADAGLAYGDNGQPLCFEKNGFRIAVVCNGLWNEDQAGSIAARLRAAEQESDYQIVFFHGGQENVHTPEAWKVRAAHRLVDSGADLVLGSHPHVLQPREVYGGAEIVYSLGNFCYGGSRQPQNRTVIYRLTLTVKDGAVVDTASEMIPCYVYTGAANNYCPAPITDAEQRQSVLDFMDGKAERPY